LQVKIILNKKTLNKQKQFNLFSQFKIKTKAILLLLESKDLYAVYKKNQQIKRQYEMAMPLNSTLHLNLNSSISNRASNYA